MFEGNISKQLESSSTNRGDLRSFRWTDLVARLSATRDLREDCGRHAGGGFAGFAETRRQEGEEGKRSFNPPDIHDANDRIVRKIDASVMGGKVTGKAQIPAAQGDREER